MPEEPVDAAIDPTAGRPPGADSGARESRPAPPTGGRLFGMRAVFTVFLPTALALAFALYARPWKDVLVTSFWCALPMLILLNGVFLVAWVVSLKQKMEPKFPIGQGLLVGTFLSLCLGAVLYAGTVMLKDAFIATQTAGYGRVALLYFFGSTAIGVAVLLFTFRLRMRAIYGATEVAVGLVVALYRVGSEPDGTTALSPNVLLAVVTAGIYLMVRGLDNIHVGLTKEPYDQVALRLFARLFDIQGRRLP